MPLLAWARLRVPLLARGTGGYPLVGAGRQAVLTQVVVRSTTLCHRFVTACIRASSGTPCCRHCPPRSFLLPPALRKCVSFPVPLPVAPLAITRRSRRKSCAPSPGRALAASLTVLCLYVSGCRSFWECDGPVSDELLTCRQLSIRAAGALDRGDAATAESLLATAVKTCPVDPESRRVYGEALWKKGDHTGAIAQLNEAIKLSSEDPALFVRRGEMLLDIGKTNEALLNAVTALDLDPTLQRAWVLRARIMRASGSGPQSLADFQRALEFEPDNRDVLLEAAELHCQLAAAPSASAQPSATGHQQRALAMLQMLADTYPRGQEPPHVLRLTGIVQLELGRNRDAAQSLAAAARAGSPDGELWYHLARAQHAIGDSSAAQLAVQQAIVASPHRGDYQELRDAIYIQMAQGSGAPRFR